MLREAPRTTTPLELELPLAEAPESYRPIAVGELAKLTEEPLMKIIDLAVSESSEGQRLNARSALPHSLARAVLQRLSQEQGNEVIAFSNLRGGIGKTTATITSAVRSAQVGFRSCILDLDSQASASLAFGVLADQKDPIFLDVWQNPSQMLRSALKQVRPGLFLLPSALENALLDSALARPVAQKTAVAGVVLELFELGIERIFIDCPPSLGAAVISSLAAATKVVIPIGSDAFSLRGLQLTLNEIGAIRSTFGLPQPELKVLFSRYDKRESASKSSFEKVQKEYAEIFFPKYIPTSTVFSRVLEDEKTIFDLGGKNPCKEAYDAFLSKLLKRGNVPLVKPAANNGGYSGTVANM